LVFALAGAHNFINSVYSAEDDFDRLGSFDGEELEQRRRDEDNINNLRDVSTDMSAFREVLADAMWEGYR
jgi:hypothetical protein